MAAQDHPSEERSVPEPEESALRFHRAAKAARQRRRSAALMQRLWQDNHFLEGFLAELGVDRGPRG